MKHWRPARQSLQPIHVLLLFFLRACILPRVISGIRVLHLGSTCYFWDSRVTSGIHVLLLESTYYIWDPRVTSGIRVLLLGFACYLWDLRVTYGIHVLHLGSTCYFWDSRVTSGIHALFLGFACYLWDPLLLLGFACYLWDPRVASGFLRACILPHVTSKIHVLLLFLIFCVHAFVRHVVLLAKQILSLLTPIIIVLNSGLTDQ